MKALIVASFLAVISLPAGAVCTTFSPYDSRCSVMDLLNHTQANPMYYAQNPAVRQARIAACNSPYTYPREPAAWCAAAFAAQHATDGSQYGSRFSWGHR